LSLLLLRRCRFGIINEFFTPQNFSPNFRLPGAKWSEESQSLGDEESLGRRLLGRGQSKSRRRKHRRHRSSSRRRKMTRSRKHRRHHRPHQGARQAKGPVPRRKGARQAKGPVPSPRDYFLRKGATCSSKLGWPNCWPHGNVVRCLVVKTTACLEGACAVKKTVKCHEICKVDDRGCARNNPNCKYNKSKDKTGSNLAGPAFKECRKDLCNEIPAYGALACKQIAMME